MESQLTQLSVQSNEKKIPEARLKLLSDSKIQTLIKEDLEKLKGLEKSIENVEKLAIAPNLSYKEDILVILVFLKKHAFICRSFIQEIIADAIQCEEEDLVIITTQKIWNSYEQGLLEREEYNKLLYASLTLDSSFQAETNQKLNELFNEKYKKFVDSSSQKSSNQLDDLAKEINKLSVKDIKSSQKLSNQNDHLPPEIHLKVTFLTLKDIAKSWDPQIKTYPEYVAEEEIKHLKSLVDQRQHSIIPESECDKIIREYETLSGIQAGKTTALHLAAQKIAPNQIQFLSIEQAMAIIKKLLGVDPNLKTDEEIKISSSPRIQDINCRDKDGKTALHYAARSAGGIIYWLLVLKADPTIKDKNGQTVLDRIPNNWRLIKDSVKQYISCWEKS